MHRSSLWCTVDEVVTVDEEETILEDSDTSSDFKSLLEVRKLKFI